MKNNGPTEGEIFIAEYLKYKEISFEQEVVLRDLKDDPSHKTRRADFYLKNYKVYLEFNGRWNNTKEDRERYKEKKAVYAKNNIPCIYLYPENLGIIDYVFTKRMIELLQKQSMKKELRLFQLKRFIEERGSIFIWLFLSVLVYSGDFSWENDSTTLIACIIVFVFQLYRIYEGIQMFFVRNVPKFYND